MKALAAEITLKFSKRLSWAGIKVKEFTGDMKLTKKEIDETGIIITTPEKWDVVTRKGGGGGDGEVSDVSYSACFVVQCSELSGRKVGADERLFLESKIINYR